MDDGVETIFCLLFVFLSFSLRIWNGRSGWGDGRQPSTLGTQCLQGSLAVAVHTDGYANDCIPEQRVGVGA